MKLDFEDNYEEVESPVMDNLTDMTTFKGDKLATSASFTFRSEAEICQVMATEVLRDFSNPVGEFDYSKFPDLLKRYFDEATKGAGSNVIIPVTSCLTTISAFIKTSNYIEKGEWHNRLYPNVWFLSIASSGTHKTTEMGNGHQWADGYDRAVALALKSDADNDEFRNKKLYLPRQITTEALIDALAKGCSGAMYINEFGSWLKSMEKSHNADLKGMFTELYDCLPYEYRTLSRGSQFIETPYISMCAISTLPWVKANINLTDVSSGFFARYLIMNPPSNDITSDPFPTGIISNIATLGAELLEVVKTNPARQLGIDPLAREIWAYFYWDVDKRLKALDESTRDILKPYFSRWHPYIGKIAMLLQPFIDRTSSTLSPQAIEGAISVVEYAIASTTFLFRGELGETHQQAMEKKVLKYIARQIQKKGKCSWATLTRSHSLEGGAEDYEKMVKTLVGQSRLLVREGDTSRQSDRELLLAS